MSLSSFHKLLSVNSWLGEAMDSGGWPNSGLDFSDFGALFQFP